MRNITHIVIHCSATPEGREVTVKEIDRWHRQRGFAKIGYHYVIHLDGRISTGRPLEEPGAHVSGHNATTIGVCYVGGVSADDVNKAKDTRTGAQKVAMAALVGHLAGRFPGAIVLGHRDFPGVAKACPSFDAIRWWAGVRKGRYTVTAGDTLYGLAKRWRTTIGDIRIANPGVAPSGLLKIGDFLQIPQT